MATYNRAHTIEYTIKSILDQTYSNWECIIIDDGCTDSTAQVLAPFTKEDKRIIFKKRPDTYLKGLPGSRNYGLDLAKGSYIIFFDDDDIVHPQNLKICIDLINRNSKVKFVHYSKKSFVSQEDIRMIKNYDSNAFRFTDTTIIEKVIKGNIGLASCTVLWDKQCFDNIRFNEELQYAEEWECYTRILLDNPFGIITKQILYYNRKHLASNTGQFYAGNFIQKQSKINASKLIINSLSSRGRLSKSLIKHFVWKAVQLNSEALFKYILVQPNVSTIEKLKAIIRFRLSPFIKLYLRIKKSLLSV